MEHIISFGGEFFEQECPFYIEMAGITYPDASYHILRTCSDIHCFEYVIEGAGTVWVDNQVNYPRTGDLYILPQGRRHDYFSDRHDPFKKIWMNVRGTLCDELLHIYGLTGVLLVKKIDALSIFEEFLATCENRELSLPCIYQKCQLVFHKLILSIADHLSSEQTGHDSRDAADKIKTYIDQHIYERFRLEELSQRFHLSSSQINRIFRKAFDTTPYDYILSRKIETAERLMKNTSLTIKEIAYKLNFADEHYFSNLFLKKTGTRPGNLKF